MKGVKIKERAFIDEVELKSYNTIKRNSKIKICGEASLKPSLIDRILISNNSENVDKTLTYYFELISEKVSKIFITYEDLKKEIKDLPLEEYNFIKKLENEDTFKKLLSSDEDIEKKTQKLFVVAVAIVKYYGKILKYFQDKVASLDIEELYSEYREEKLNEVEELIKEITVFYTKLYYKYPLQEEKETSKWATKLMEKYNIDEQIKELESTLKLIRNIVFFQLKRKEEKEREKQEKEKEKWNKIFAAIGIAIGIIQILQTMF